MNGKQVRLFLVDGTPGGLTTAEITNWTGHVLSARRSDLAELLNRDEVKRTGVYLLLGDDEEAVGGTRCYVGEGDVVADRLRSHAREKPFWNQVVVITSKDANLTKSHGRFLESRLIGLAQRAGRVSLENSTAPPLPPLPEADASDMDYFVGQLQIVLPVLGVDAVRVRPNPTDPVPSAGIASPVFSLSIPRSAGRVARAQQIDGEFVLLAGSAVVPEWNNTGTASSTRTAYAGYSAKHAGLIADGSIVIDPEGGRVTRDIVFSSPSTAGAVVLGHSCNGRTSWRSDDGTTFGVWESRGVDDR